MGLTGRCTSATGAVNELVSHCRDLGGNEVRKRENGKLGSLNFNSTMSLKGWHLVFDGYSLPHSLVI